MMQSKNLNYQFFLEYYSQTNFEQEDNFSGNEKNAELCENRLNPSLIPAALDQSYLSLQPKHFSLVTTYPGLLLGTGVAHAFGGKGEAALGFTFDYVTGLPYIPGSSLKGLLRSAFTLANGDYICEKLQSLTNDEWQKQDIKNLEIAIFGPCQKDHSTEANGQDIFLDSYIAGTRSPDNTFLAIDTITPHRQGDLKELSSPNPISFIKVKPGVRFEFRFLLSNYEAEGFYLSVDNKAKLFEEILLELGIGAKTNVGYGTLERTDGSRPVSNGATAKEDSALGVSTELEIGKKYQGIVRDIQSNDFVNIQLDDLPLVANIRIEGKQQRKKLQTCKQVVVVYRGERTLSNGSKKKNFTVEEIIQ